MTLEKALYLEKLTVSFDGFKALDSLSLYVDPGELLCVIGPMSLPGPNVRAPDVGI